ncbi:MAG: hypothetical protein E6R03_13700 [Hyphomicrobiaceae bacterium]|nr:MAG: hypothetical protein E6R03_13700 [Hyphomicrobiaceae bacterium]
MQTPNPASERRISLRDIDIAMDSLRHAIAHVGESDFCVPRCILIDALQQMHTERALVAASGSARLQELRSARATLRRAYLHVSLDSYASYVVRNALNELQAEMDETR